MKKKYLWWLLPFTTMWLSISLMFHTLPENPLDDWWAIPLFVTYILMMLISVILCVAKTND